MWKIIQEILPILLVVLLLSQYVIPLIFNTQKWWLFKPSKKKEEKIVNPSSLVDELKAAKTYVDDVKAKTGVVKEKVEGNLKAAEDLKKEADKLI